MKYFFENKWFWLAVLALSLVVSVRPMTDPDLGWHLRLGQELVQEGRLPRTNSLTFTLPGYEYVNHSWLFDGVSFVLYDNLGTWGLAGWHYLWAAAVVFGLAVVTTELAGDEKWALLAIPLSFLMWEFVGLRAHLPTMLGLVVTICWLFRLFKQSEQKPGKISWWMVGVFWLWANLHAGFVMGFLTVGVWLSADGLRHVMDKRKVDLWRYKNILLTTALGIVATAFNPYGVKLYEFIFQLSGNAAARTFNSDWVPLFSPALPADNLPMRLLLVVLVLFALFGAKSGFRKKYMLMALGILTLYSIRFSMMLWIVLIPMVVLATKEWLGDSLEKANILEFSRTPKWLVLATSVVVVMISWGGLSEAVCANNSGECYAQLKSYPYGAVEYLNGVNEELKVFNFYTWGGYLEWQAPGHKYFIDGRMDSFYVDGESFLAEFASIVEMWEGWEDKFESYEVDVVVLPRSVGLIDELKKMGWIVEVEDEVSVVLLLN